MNTTQETTARYTVDERDDRYAVVDTHGDDARTVSEHDDWDAAWNVVGALNKAHQEAEDRKGVVAGLRALANFLESTPEVPAMHCNANTYMYSDAASFIETARSVTSERRRRRGT